MQFIVALALSVTASFANEFHRSPLRAGRVELAPLDKIASPRERAQADGRALHRRMTELLAKNELQFMMIFPSGASAEIVDYATELHQMMPADLAGLFIGDLAELEARIAGRYGLAPERVAREVDVLIELARLNLKKTNAVAIQAVLQSNSPTLGAAFQTLFVAELKTLKTPRTLALAGQPDLAILGSIYQNLTRHLGRALERSRRVLGRRPSTHAAQAWLNIEAPAPIVIAAEPTIEFVGTPGVAQAVDPTELRAFVAQKRCGSLLDRAEDAPPTVGSDDL